MSTHRRTLTTRQQLEVLVRYSRCPLCGLKFNTLAEIDFDHIGQLALTNDNSLENFRPLHRDDCHKKKTAEDAAKRGKARRLASDVEESRRRILAKAPGQPRQKNGRIQSRGFSKAKRPFR